jgi:DNA-binding GntR family transcriptional regulator
MSAAPSPSGARSRRKLQPSTLPDEVLRELRAALIRGDLQPGDRIRADLVAADLGVSVIPVREALRVLLAESRVELEPHRGYRVTVLSGEQIAELFLICGLLEREALERGVAAMDDAADARMAALLAQLDVAAAAGGAGEGDDLWELVAAHQDFHFVPMECSGLPRLVTELRRLWGHTDHYRTLYLFRDASTYGSLHEEHRALYEACLRRDAGEAVRLNDAHRARVLRQMGVA